MKDNKINSYPIIYKDNCKACGRCIIGCKYDVLEFSNELNANGYPYVIYKGEGCNGCRDCYYTCPEPLAIEVHTFNKVEGAKE